MNCSFVCRIVIASILFHVCGAALAGRWRLEKVVGNAKSFNMAVPIGGAESFGFVS